MEHETTNHQDVAEPDQIVSGAAGTGQENEELEWMKRHTVPSLELVKRRNGPGEGRPGSGDMIVVLADRQDRIARRLDKKIGRLELRIAVLEERGRP